MSRKSCTLSGAFFETDWVRATKLGSISPCFDLLQQWLRVGVGHRHTQIFGLPAAIAAEHMAEAEQNRRVKDLSP